MPEDGAATTEVVSMRVICDACQRVYVAYEATHDAYGLVPAVTPHGDIRFDAPDAPLGAELDDLVHAVADDKRPYSNHNTDNLQAAEETSIDPSPSGEKYYLWGLTPCHHCGQFANGRLVPGTRRTVVRVPVVMVERTIWNSLAFAEKRARVRAALNRLWASYGYAPLPDE
ncbi:MAG: hypothetical protein FJX72_00170 [Armatimonadetes bacterium]|nr:hypothetical protein [Armatimonadota bacterium]